jgi:hypothetical protein
MSLLWSSESMYLRLSINIKLLRSMVKSAILSDLIEKILAP